MTTREVRCEPGGGDRLVPVCPARAELLRRPAGPTDLDVP